MLTLQSFRDHLKIDEGDEDGMLALYAAAAIEAAETFTGRVLKAGQRCDVIENPTGSCFPLKAEPSGPVSARVMIDCGVRQYPVTVTGNKAYLPVELDCGATRLELCYRVGPPCEPGKDTLVAGPAMMEMGILKFVAHAFTHRGDSPNDWAVDSGAVTLWNGYRSIVF